MNVIMSDSSPSELMYRQSDAVLHFLFVLACRCRFCVRVYSEGVSGVERGGGGGVEM